MKAVEATAPCRVDLAGGDLDVWPAYLFHPGAVALTVAIDRRAWCRVETGVEGIQIESKDALSRAAAGTVSELLDHPHLSPTARVLDALGAAEGLKVVTQSRVPVGSGLGGSSALAVATAAATARALGRSVDPDVLWPLVRDSEARAIGGPTGIRDYHTALRGGVVAVHLEPGQARVETLAVDPARVEECLLLVDSGANGPPGPSAWDVLKGQLDGDERVRRSLAAIAEAARGVREALAEERFEEVAPLLGAEWEARKQLAAGVTAPEIDRIVDVVREAGGAARACGAGGVVAVWAPPGSRGPGRREAVEAALGKAGLRAFAARVDLRGLEVD